MHWTVRTLVATAFVLGVIAPSAQANIGISSFTAQVLDPSNHVVTQAGSTPYVGITDFTLSDPSDPVSDIRVDLPPGLISNPQATPTKCITLGSCDPTTQIGTVDITVASLLPVTGIPVYNMEPAPGTVSDFAFDGAALGLGATHIIGGVRDTTDYGLFFTIHNASGLPITHSKLTFFGNAADHGTGAPPAPFIRLPTACAGPQTTTLTVVSANGHTATAGDVTKDDLANPIGATGCDHVPFAPSLGVTPDTTKRDSPAGVTVGLQVPWQNDPTQLASSHVKDTVVVLPPGMSINPSAANGLQACSDQQFGQGDDGPATCPAASKIGTVEIDTAVLPAPLKGSVYLGSPQPDNPYRLFVQAGDKATQGLSVKLEGKVSPDPKTGQLTTTFPDTPQVPFSNFILTFGGGPSATLATPLDCGQATTTSTITPYSSESAPYLSPPATPSSAFTVDSDGSGGACNGTPFSLGFSAGTQNTVAGAFSPFTLNVTRDDGQQYLAGLTVEQPPGLLGILQSVPLCDDAAAAQGTCPTASRVGTSTVSSGAGSAPFSLSGPVYLTGPYAGAPFGLAIVIHAVAGPFDLGTVVVRAAIKVDQTDSHLVIDTPTLPTILQGIPLRLRTVTVAIDRPQFLFNPTNCDPLAVKATFVSSQGAKQDVSAPFQSTGCDTLPYAPKMTATTHAVKKGQPASLSVALTQGPGEANTKSVSVHLPSALAANFQTLQKACPQATFQADPKTCAASSHVGTVTAATPLLAQPLTGAVYLEAHEAGKLPSLEAVLEGSGISVDLSGTITLGSGITSTFATVPDVPITSFRLDLPASPNPALAANQDLCSVALPFTAAILGQNGKQVNVNSAVGVAGCGLQIQRAKVRRHSVAVTVLSPGAGNLLVTGKGLTKARKHVASAGVYTLRVKLSKSGTKALRKALHRKKKRQRKLVLKLKGSYAPAKGATAAGEALTASSATKKVTFKK